MRTRIFTSADQIKFAELSGDNNPLHLDKMVARRSLFGGPVVHGIHLLLRAIDGWLSARPLPITIRSVRARFIRQVAPGEVIKFVVVAEKDCLVKIEVRTGSVTAARIVLEWTDAPAKRAIMVPAVFPKLCPPRIVPLDKMASQAGTLDLAVHPSTVTDLFPNLLRCLAPSEIGILLATTRLVGVECPGLHSIFAELSLTADASTIEPTLAYRVTSFDAKYGMVRMNVIGPGLVGEVQALIRPEPQAQAAYETIKSAINRLEFAGQRALVVGGSRGLGEVAAKILCAGGAQVKLTFHLGAADAQHVVQEINTGGGNSNAFQLDVLNLDGKALDDACRDWAPTHLYYFATPGISASTPEHFSHALFQKFCDYYVTGFAASVETLRRLGLKKVFYPSTIYVTELPNNLAEYIATKAAGEVLCASYGKNYPDLTIHSPRLPRMATDQTASLSAVENPDPVPLMINFLRDFRDSTPVG